jgi:hypothetical protein
MSRLMTEMQINDIISSGIGTKGLESVGNRPSVGSLSDTDEFSTDEMYRFLLNSRNIIESPITGCEIFLGRLLHPSNESYLEDQVHNLLLEYYSITYMNNVFRIPFTSGLPNSIIVKIQMTQYG